MEQRYLIEWRNTPNGEWHREKACPYMTRDEYTGATQIVQMLNNLGFCNIELRVKH